MTAHKAWHTRGYLPHFDGPDLVQAVTFRLADSLPKMVYDNIVAAAKDDSDRSRRLERMIDEGRGACLLRDPANAAIVQSALTYFDGERYRLLAWVIMPNHVHALVEQLNGATLGGVVKSWKSFTAKAINRQKDTTGQIWAADYHDRFIRDAVHYAAAVRYIEHNPVKAALVDRVSAWPFSSAFKP